MSHLERDRTLEMRGGRKPVLRLSDPRTEKCLAALDLSGVNLPDLREFSNRLLRESDAWERRGGGAERGRISKGDANRLLRLQLAKLAGGAL